MKRDAFIFVFSAFVIWRVTLFIIVFFGVKFVPLQNDFLGGGITEYIKNPYLWSWFNFDGEHYLSIIREGYRPLTYFFFPGFPLLIKYIAGLFVGSMYSYAVLGLTISNAIFFVALIGFWKLITMDYDEKIAKIAVVLLLVFPTSFYFASFYSEALFLAAVVWSMYFVRRGYFAFSGILGGLSSLTRVVGVSIFPSLLLESLFPNGKFKKIKITPKLIYIFLTPLGLLLYMYYLWRVTGDPLNFLHTVGIFGDQRSSSFVMLPQVFYRYILKIIPNLNINYFPSLFTTFMEFFVSLLFLVVSILSFYKLRLSYSVYILLGYLIPTLSGSFSSIPRYVVVLFPGFILASLWIRNKSVFVKTLVYGLSSICLIISTAMFVRGYWIS